MSAVTCEGCDGWACSLCAVTDEDGIDGPWERAMDAPLPPPPRVPRDEALTVRPGAAS